MMQRYTRVNVCELHIQEEVWYFQEKPGFPDTNLNLSMIKVNLEYHS